MLFNRTKTQSFSKLKGIGCLMAIAVMITGIAGCNDNQTTSDNPNGNVSSVEGENLPGQGIKVTPGYSVLEELFQTEIVNIGLEQLGYEIQSPKQLAYATMHVDIANGGITYMASHWQKLHEEFFLNSGGDEKLERMGVFIADALQGYKIDKATAEKYNITSIEQLQDPEIAALFDTNGDGRANLTGCNPGWGCELVIEHHLDEYGLRKTVEHDQGQYFALIADTITRYQQGEPILFYTWTPLWVGGVLQEGEDVTWLEVPYTDLPESQGKISEADTSADGKNLGFAVDEQVILANQTFINNNPAAEKFFELVQVPIEDVSLQNQLIQDGEDSPRDIRGHAENWVKENQDQFDAWVEEALAVQ